MSLKTVALRQDLGHQEDPPHQQDTTNEPLVRRFNHQPPPKKQVGVKRIPRHSFSAPAMNWTSQCMGRQIFRGIRG